MNFPLLGELPALVPASLHQKALRTIAAYLAGHATVGEVSTTVADLVERMTRAMQIRTLGFCAGIAVSVGLMIGLLPFFAMVRAGQGKDAQVQLPATKAQAQTLKAESGRSLTGTVRDGDGRPVVGATLIAGQFARRNIWLRHRVQTDGMSFMRQKTNPGSPMFWATSLDTHQPPMNCRRSLTNFPTMSSIWFS